MNKHTEGPWVVYFAVDGFEIRAEDGGEYNVRVAILPGQDIDKANSRLIASSPDLLKALQDLAYLDSPEYLEGFKTGRHNYPDVDRAVALKRAQEAIRKAVGNE